MSKSQDPIENIVQHLNSKAVVKQETYKHLLETFSKMKSRGKELVKVIKSKIHKLDSDIKVEFQDVFDHEFRIKIAGDTLIFMLHTNVVTFEENHGAVNNSYVKEEPYRGFYGQIVIYNFMSDSLKYNRMNDPGYLVARLFLNYENRFLVEGEGQLNFLFKEVSDQQLSELDIDVIIQLSITAAAENDLITPPFQEIKHISLGQHMDKDKQVGRGEKIGFRMSYQDNTE